MTCHPNCPLNLVHTIYTLHTLDIVLSHLQAPTLLSLNWILQANRRLACEDLNNHGPYQPQHTERSLHYPSVAGSIPHLDATLQYYTISQHSTTSSLQTKALPGQLMDSSTAAHMTHSHSKAYGGKRYDRAGNFAGQTTYLPSSVAIPEQKRLESSLTTGQTLRPSTGFTSVLPQQQGDMHPLASQLAIQKGMSYCAVFIIYMISCCYRNVLSLIYIAI